MVDAVGNRTLAKHISWSAARAWGERGITLLVFAILARVLPVSDIGTLAYLSAFVLIAQTIVDGGLSEWLVRSPDASHEIESSIFWFQAAFGTVVAAVLVILTMLFSAFLLHRADGPEITFVLALTIPIGCMERLPEARLRREFRFDQLAVRSWSTVVVGGVVGVGLALYGAGIWSLVFKQLSESIVRFVMVFGISQWRPKIHFRIQEVVAPIRFGINVLGTYVLDALTTRVDIFVVGTFLGPIALGYYYVALRIQQIIVELFSSVTWQAAFPHFAALRGHTAAITALHRKLMRASADFVAPVVATVAGLSPILIPLLFGARWQPAWPILQWLCLIPLGLTTSAYNSCILLAAGEGRAAVLLGVLNCTATLLGAIIGSHFGIVGASIGVSSRSLVMIFAGYFLVRNLSRLTPLDVLGTVLPGYCASAVAFIVSRTVVMNLHGLPNFVVTLVGGLAGVAVGLGIVAIFAPTLAKKIANEFLSTSRHLIAKPRRID